MRKKKKTPQNSHKETALGALTKSKEISVRAKISKFGIHTILTMEIQLKQTTTTTIVKKRRNLIFVSNFSMAMYIARQMKKNMNNNFRPKKFFFSLMQILK